MFICTLNCFMMILKHDVYMAWHGMAWDGVYDS